MSGVVEPFILFGEEYPYDGFFTTVNISRWSLLKCDCYVVYGHYFRTCCDLNVESCVHVGVRFYSSVQCRRHFSIAMSSYYCLFCREYDIHFV